MNATMSSNVRIELRTGKSYIYQNVTYIDYDDPFGRLMIYRGKQLLDAIPLGNVKRWRFERPRGAERRNHGTDKRPQKADRRQQDTERRRQSANQ